jgi:hypothetical protein
MLNDAVWILLFIICLPKTGSTGENPADHGQGKMQQITATIPTVPFLKPTISRLHDARHFWRQGHKTFSGFIKARERPRERGGRRRAGGHTERERPRKTGEIEQRETRRN